MRKALSHLLAVFTLTAFIAGLSAFAFPAPSHMTAPLAPAAAGPVQPIRFAEDLAAAQAGPQAYQVSAGDTLSSIAKAEYGSASWWPQIWRQNRRILRDNPNLITVGMRLRIGHRWAKAPPLPRVAPPVILTAYHSGSSPPPAPPPAAPAVAGVYSYTALEQLWVSAGGPASAETAAATIAECESGGSPDNYYGKSEGVPYQGDSVQASGLWQILGQVVPGNIFNPLVNALNAVSKFRASGDTFAQWVCQA